jgi:hypothetical protein
MRLSFGFGGVLHSFGMWAASKVERWVGGADGRREAEDDVWPLFVMCCVVLGGTI